MCEAHIALYVRYRRTHKYLSLLLFMSIWSFSSLALFVSDVRSCDENQRHYLMRIGENRGHPEKQNPSNNPW